MKAKRTVALTLLSLFSLVSLCGIVWIVYIIAPAQIQKPMRRFLKYELSITRRNLRIVRRTVRNFFGRLSEQERIELKRKELTAKRSLLTRLVLIVHRVLTTVWRVFQSFFYTFRSVIRIGRFSVSSGVQFFWRQLDRVDRAIVAVLAKIVLFCAKVERFLTFGVRFVVSKADLLVDRIYSVEQEAPRDV